MQASHWPLVGLGGEMREGEAHQRSSCGGNRGCLIFRNQTNFCKRHNEFLHYLCRYHVFVLHVHGVDLTNLEFVKMSLQTGSSQHPFHFSENQMTEGLMQ